MTTEVFINKEIIEKEKANTDREIMKMKENIEKYGDLFNKKFNEVFLFRFIPILNHFIYKKNQIMILINCLNNFLNFCLCVCLYLFFFNSILIFNEFYLK